MLVSMYWSYTLPDNFCLQLHIEMPDSLYREKIQRSAAPLSGMVLRCTAAAVLLVGGLLGQEDVSTVDPMQASIEKQRASTRRQVPGSANTASFFSVPWTSEPAVTAARLVSPNEDCEAVAPEMLARLIKESSQRESVDPKLVRAVIMKESGARPCAVSPKGAQGLMQLMPATQSDFGVTDPFDPEQNVTAGVRYLKQLRERFKGNLALTLAAYNAGPQRITDGKVPEIPETISYVSDVLSALQGPSEAETKP